MNVTHVCFSQWRMACLNIALWLPEGHISQPAFTNAPSSIKRIVLLKCSQVANQWNFLRWCREWLLQAIFSLLWMWQLEENDSSQPSPSSHLSQLSSSDLNIPWCCFLGGSLKDNYSVFTNQKKMLKKYNSYVLETGRYRYKNVKVLSSSGDGM